MKQEKKPVVSKSSQYLTYKSWQKCKSRCNNPNNVKYHTYGAKGIKVCDEWNKSFEAFFNDMGARPSLSHTLDRIDSRKGYSKDNCRWATYKEQNRNRPGFNVVKPIGTESKCLSAWAEENNVNYKTLYTRLSKGMNFYEAVTKPVRLKTIKH